MADVALKQGGIVARIAASTMDTRMTMDESEKDDLRVIPFVCFETWRFKRTAAKLGALLLIPAALLLISVVLYCSWIAVATLSSICCAFYRYYGCRSIVYR